MTPEKFIIAKASEAIQALYSVEVPEAQLQVQVTRKEFEGDYTLVVFPLLKCQRLLLRTQEMQSESGSRQMLQRLLHTTQ